MPDLGDPIHLRMLNHAVERGQPAKDGLYGLHWGNPDVAPLKSVRDRFLAPYIHLDHTALEVGPGGGRWTRYLLSFKKLYAVDYHAELLRELAKNFVVPHLVPLKNNGCDFPGVPDCCVDFLFSFGVFVHIELTVIDQYLGNMRRILKPSATAVIQYSDKRKPEAQRNAGFSANDPDRMRELLSRHGYVVMDEDVTTLPHSAVVRFGCAP